MSKLHIKSTINDYVHQQKDRTTNLEFTNPESFHTNKVICTFIKQVFIVNQNKVLKIQDLLFNHMNKLFIRRTWVSLRQVQFCCLIQSYPHFEPFQHFQNWNDIAGLRCFSGYV